MKKEMHKADIDLAVLLIFFARPNTLREVFEKVKKARPAKLFLACDGPRKNRPTDVENIEACKAIVSDIDWECEVHTRYMEENQGCGKGPSDAITWAFEHVDKLAILEDDCVPDDTYFQFMKEMLDYYEHDTRVGLISGYNHFKEWDTAGDSYLFTKCGATLGWGTWKRVWDHYDFYIKDFQNTQILHLLGKELFHKKAVNGRLGDWKRTARETACQRVNYWDYQFDFVKYTQSYLSIVPAGNLIYNIGVGPGSTHTENTKKTQWKPGQVLFMPTVPMQFPLVHPKHRICDRYYDEKLFNTLFYPPRIVKLFRKIKRRLWG